MRSSLVYLKRSVPGVVPGVLLLVLLVGMGGWLGLRAWRPPVPPARHAPAQRPVPAQRHVVEIRDFAFEPARLEVAVGDTVVWVNRDVVPHTATGATSESDAPWDSGPLREGASWHRVVQEAGRHVYYCRFHPVMKGSFVVKK